MSTLFCLRVIQVRANQLQFVNQVEKEEIIESVKKYFEARYRSHITLQLPDFEDLIAESSLESSFLPLEMEKLEIELYHAKVKQLGYSEAKLILEFFDFQVDEETQTATVSVIEGHDVVFEKYKPTVSTMRNLQHRITLRKDDNLWKIASDDYDDYLWRMIRSTNLELEDLIVSIDATLDRTPSAVEDQSGGTLCSLPDDQSSHPYNRNGAVAYAHQWATHPQPYNPKYPDFTDSGGDCTNFVNQAIHEGSNAEMVFGGIHGFGSLGWYVYSDSDYTKAWTGVDFIHEFITEHWVWPRPGIDDPDGPGGPEGCMVAEYQAREGDLIQFEWFEDVNNDGIDDDKDDPIWDHSVIIVKTKDYGYEVWHWVAGHSDDVDNYPLDYFDYNDIRFIHIDRIDGYFKLYIPLVIKDTGYEGEQMQTPLMEPYPAPIESSGSLAPSPYPPPSESVNQNPEPYPAP